MMNDPITSMLPIGNSCHVAAVHTSSNFPSAALPRKIVDFFAKLSTTSHANQQVHHAEQISY
jgi:hypothetical protein